MGIIQPYIPHLPFELYYRNLNNLEIFAYMKCLLNAIKTVHKIGFVHRDIKPANFIFLKEARTGYLIDFGLSEPIVQSGYYDVNSNLKSKTATGTKDKNKESKALPSAKTKLKCDCDNKSNYQLCQICWSRQKNCQERSGTPGYRSPEILQKSEEQGPPIDLWAAGCILIQILSKKAPFFPAKAVENKNKTEGEKEDEKDSIKYKYLDNDAICFSHQLMLVGYQAMFQAMSEINLNLVLSDNQINSLSHNWSTSYLKNLCQKLADNETISDSHNDSFDELEKSYAQELYQICFDLLNPSYFGRKCAEKLLEEYFS